MAKYRWSLKMVFNCYMQNLFNLKFYFIDRYSKSMAYVTFLYNIFFLT